MATNKQRQEILEQEIDSHYKVFKWYRGIMNGSVENAAGFTEEEIQIGIDNNMASIRTLCFALSMFVKSVDSKYPWSSIFDDYRKQNIINAKQKIENGNSAYWAFL